MKKSFKTEQEEQRRKTEQEELDEMRKVFTWDEAEVML